MPTTISGTSGVTFTDGTTLNTAVGTTAVLNATAGASVGAVGSYALLIQVSGTVGLAVGATVAGSTLRYAGSPGVSSQAGGGSNSGTAPSGTWRAMGYPLAYTYNAYGPVSNYGATLWLRIS